MAIVCGSGNRRIVPLHFSLWSTIAPDYHRENTELRRILEQIRRVHGSNGIYVYDRGGDNIELFRHFTRHGLNFIVRLRRRKGAKTQRGRCHYFDRITRVSREDRLPKNSKHPSEAFFASLR